MPKLLYMKNTLTTLVIFCVVLIAGCKKQTVEIIKEVPQVHAWTMVPALTGLSSIQLTSVPLNDSTIAVANNESITYLTPGSLKGNTSGDFIFNYFSGSYTVRPSITKNTGVTLNDATTLRVFATQNPINQPGGNFTFTPHYPGPDSLILNIPKPSVFNNPCYPIVADRYVLAPIGTIYPGYNKRVCALLKFNTSNTFIPNQLSVFYDTVKYINLLPAPGAVGFSGLGGYFSAAFFDKFFVYYDNQFFRIDTAGNVKSFGIGPVAAAYGVGQMFTIGDKLFTEDAGKICVSTDHGESWQLFFDGSRDGSAWGLLKYFNTADGDLYGVYHGQVTHITLNGNVLNSAEIVNDGVENTEVTSVNKCGKYAFLTTLAGVYYRSVDSLNVLKK